jgi:hypothetical protein
MGAVADKMVPAGIIRYWADANQPTLNPQVRRPSSEARGTAHRTINPRPPTTLPIRPAWHWPSLALPHVPTSAALRRPAPYRADCASLPAALAAAGWPRWQHRAPDRARISSGSRAKDDLPDSSQAAFRSIITAPIAIAETQP